MAFDASLDLCSFYSYCFGTKTESFSFGIELVTIGLWRSLDDINGESVEIGAGWDYSTFLENGPSVGIALNTMGELIGVTLSFPQPAAVGVIAPIDFGLLNYLKFPERAEGSLVYCNTNTNTTGLFGNAGDNQPRPPLYKS